MNDDKIMLVIKSVLYLSISLFLLLSAYLLFNDFVDSIEPEVLTVEASQWKELLEFKTAKAKLKDWTWDYSSDVEVMDEKYPLVVLRSGFKVIKTSEYNALVGWRMDIVNTSKKHSYYTEAEYVITDGDGFHIESSTNKVSLPAESFGLVLGTMEIPISDLGRVVSGVWTILISEWETNERDSKGRRYERLAALVKDENKRPVWLRSAIEENRYLAYLPGVWALINSIIFPATEEFENEKKENKKKGFTPLK